jgi:hypothetical protein
MGANAFLALDLSVGIGPIGLALSGGDTLCLKTPLFFGGVLSGVGAGDAIQLDGITATSFLDRNENLDLLGSNGATLATLAFDGDYMASNFQLDAITDGTEIDFIPGST